MYNKSYEKFKENLTTAQKYEKWIGNFFDVEEYNDDYKYDIKLKNGIKIEVKNDFMTRTGNIAVEYECRGEPSGIKKSESDYFMFIFPYLNEIWKIKTEKLRHLINDFKIGLYQDNYTSPLLFTSVQGGDLDKDTGEKVSKLYLMKRSEVAKFFKILKINIPIYE